MICFIDFVGFDEAELFEKETCLKFQACQQKLYF